MTSPTVPEAVAEEGESPTILRTGIVTALVESDNITVKVSGSDVLVRASYLFPQYQPVLGDIVVIAKQDAQWFVLGTQSGPITSAVSAISNPSFEDGATGSTPTGWSITSVSAAGGTITFTQQPGSYIGQPISGVSVGQIEYTSNGAAANSQSNIFSPFADADPGERWAFAFWIAGGIVSSNTLVFITTFFQWYDSSSTLISEDAAQTVSLLDAGLTPVLVRPAVSDPSFAAPLTTAFVRVRINVQVAMTVPSGGSISDVFIDHVLLRKVT